MTQHPADYRPAPKPTEETPHRYVDPSLTTGSSRQSPLQGGHTRAGSSHTSITYLPASAKDGDAQIVNITPGEETEWLASQRQAPSQPPDYAADALDGIPALEPLDGLADVVDWWREEPEFWWSLPLYPRPPGPGMLPVLAASTLHDHQSDLLKVSVTPPDITPASTTDIPIGWHPPTADELRAAIPHQNAYYCRHCNGWIIIQRTRALRPTHQWPRGYDPAHASLPERVAFGDKPVECSKSVDGEWNHRPRQTHHYHRYQSIIPADTLNPPFHRPVWDNSEIPPPMITSDIVDSMNDEKFPVGHFPWRDLPFHAEEADPNPVLDTVDTLDLYMCCRCTTNIVSTRRPIPAIIPKMLMDDLIRERLFQERGPFRVVLALELILKLIERALWQGDARSINTESPTFVRQFGQDASALRIFERLRFQPEENKRLSPPDVQDPTIRALLLRAWVEVGAYLASYKRQFPNYKNMRDEGNAEHRTWVTVNREGDDILELLGAHPNQIPRGMVEAPQPFFDSEFEVLGLTQGSFTPELLHFAYEQQINCDPRRIPLYFTALNMLVNKYLPQLARSDSAGPTQPLRLVTESLEILVQTERSKERWTSEEFWEAAHALGFGEDRELRLNIEDVEVEFVADAYRDAVKRSRSYHQQQNTGLLGTGLTPGVGAEVLSMEGWSGLETFERTSIEQRKRLRDALKVLAEGYANKDLYQLWKKSGEAMWMDPDKAYSTLDVPMATSDEMLLTVYQMRVQDAPSELSKMREALEVIAETRNSARLRTFVQQGIDIGDDGAAISRPEWPRGLNQLGNTCYLNSLLQYFNTIKDLREVILTARPVAEQVKNAASDSGSSKPIVVDALQKYTDADLQKHRVGGRLVTRREIERSKQFLVRLGELFFEMEWAETAAITPSLELAKLALVTSKDEEDDALASAGDTSKPNAAGAAEASSSSASTDATLVEDSPANALIPANVPLPKTGGPSSAGPAPNQPTSVLGKRAREVEEEMEVEAGISGASGSASGSGSGSSRPAHLSVDHTAQHAIAKPRSPRSNDGSPPPDKTMRIEEPGKSVDNEDVEMAGPQTQVLEHGDDDADMEEVDIKSDEAEGGGSSVGSNSPTPMQWNTRDEEPIRPASTKPVPPPLPPRKQTTKTTDSTMMFGKQHDVSECMDNCMFQIETALLKFDQESSTDGDKTSIIKRLFYGKIRQRINTHPLETSSQGKAVVNEKEDLFAHLPVNVSEEGYDLYDGLSGYFYDKVEFEGKQATMEVSLVDLPPILQIQLQRVQFNRETLQPYKSQAYIKFGETLYMDRFLDDADSEKRTKAREIQARLTVCRERIEALTQSEGVPIVDALTATQDFFDKQTALDFDFVTLDFVRNLGEEAELVKREIAAYRQEVVQLKVQLEELWRDEQMAEYELTSVFIHRGSSPSWGHYFFYARCLPDRPDEWFKYNDSDVRMVSKEEVLADTTGSTANPYLLVFARKDSGVVHTVNRQVQPPAEPSN